MRPIIGVTSPWSVETWGDSLESGGYFYVGRPYIEALSKYGATPMLIVPEYNEESLEEHLDSILDVVDGLLFTGGGDVKTKYPEGLPTLREQQPIRYDFEKALMKRAYDRKIPVIGICRGFQMIIETFGGSLSEDTVDNHKQNLSGAEPWHEVEINKQSKLYNIFGREDWDVNSFHVQKVENVPENFIVSARAKDGVVEGVEAVNDQFIAGFQFHPEELSWKDDSAGDIIKWFVKAAKEGKSEESVKDYD